MKIEVIPSYEEVFGKPAPTIESLIGHIRSVDILAYLSLLNAELYHGHENDLTFQKELTGKLLSYWLPEVRNDFLSKILPFIKKNNNQFNFFKSVYVSYFIHNEFINYKSNGSVMKSKEESLILEAYFIYADKYGKEHVPINNIPLNNDALFFQKLTWPFAIKQFDFNETVDPFFQSVRLAKFLEHLYLNLKYKDKVTEYLNYYGKHKVYNFVMDFMNIMNLCYSKRKDGDFYISIIKDTPGYTEILNKFSININDYKNNVKLQKDYLGIRSKPLLKTENGEYIVLSWKFFLTASYIGIIFDFSDISKIAYPEIKKMIGEEISEPKIFKGIMEYAFYGKHKILNFDDNNKGYPDFYLRDGQYVYLFEFKDYLITTDVIASNSFDKIREFIDDRFIKKQSGKNKGISQLIQQINTIENGGFDFDEFEKKSIKKRNLTIIPIIVTNHYLFQMGGINSYLIRKMNENFDKNKFSFKRVMPVTVIDFLFLFKNSKRIREKETNLFELIKNYHNYLHNNSKDLFKANASFEESFSRNFRNKVPPQKQKGFIEAIFKAVGVTPELTN